ncbi:MAG TPA: CoA-acylating methylmalonate-semialdehyde dehydrogenase [Gemmatimonadaceae bacterium]|nr:CoA-acylating methylmalonate-semialdehyde dehydrogenase [Gemmatimonadaceae bacterium]
MTQTLRNFVGGEWVQPSGAEYQENLNPASGEPFARVPLSGKSAVDDAVAAAKAAFPGWRETPPVVRARFLFKLKHLLEENFEELARLVTIENGKTLDEARGSLRRGIENVEHACGIPTLMMGDTLEDVSSGIDCEFVRQPMGVFAAITPFNFPAMVPMWFLPYAIGTGNTFILKPSEQVPLSQNRIFELIQETGLPKGVVNLVHGGKDAVNAILEHPDIVGVSFVGSSPIARHVYKTAAAHGKRVQALGGAKNHIIVMPDADLDRAVAIAAESVFGCAGQRCLAGSVIVGTGDVYQPLRKGIMDAAKRIKVGNGLDAGVTMGPVVSKKHKERVLEYIESGVSEGAKLAVDGRNPQVSSNPKGQFIGPTVFEGVKPNMRIGREEIFGPVATVSEAKTLDDAIAQVHASEFANAVSIFTQSGRMAREFKYRVGVSMIGINIGVASPMAFFPFGGTKGSFFGDLKAHGKDSIEFYTDKKVVISRWN